MEDTTVLNLQVYNIPKSFSYLNHFQFIQNSTDVQLSAIGGVDYLHLIRPSETGSRVWNTCYKLAKVSLGRLLLDNRGDIWLTGTTSPLVSGIVTHFSPSGAYLEQKCQFKLGFSLGSMTGFLPIGNNEYLSAQSGYYNNSSLLILNRIASDMNFACFDYPHPTPTDTSFTIVDSGSTKIGFVKRPFGSTTILSFPIGILATTLSSGPLVCNTANNPFLEEKPELKNSPFYVGDLSPGLYWIEITALNLRRKFFKE